ncbi:MAG TPA: hypothetical protein VM555_05940 [Tahibacter sp.]|jgi:hypothetical protein|nr:hypothetical protein [Tahibacter sp.]
MKTALVISIGLITFCTANAQTPANEIVNGDFSSQLSGWSGCFTACTWNSETADGSAGGSLKLDGGTQVQQASANSNCFAVTPGANYHFGLKGKSTFPQISSSISMTCTAFAAAGCTGESTVLGLALTPQPSGFFLESGDWPATIPAGYTSAYCTPEVMGRSPALVDDVYFIKNDEIFANDFE